MAIIDWIGGRWFHCLWPQVTFASYVHNPQEPTLSRLYAGGVVTGRSLTASVCGDGGPGPDRSALVTRPASEWQHMIPASWALVASGHQDDRTF